MSEQFSLDARGVFCPEPVMMLHQQFRKMSIGDELDVVASDPSTQRDIPKFCAFLNHELISQQEIDGEYLYRLRKLS
ncbi:MAG: sulfurtransferase TusA [Pseudomonadales bacterium]|nr:sulfurtransferase TusA [Pseudomonadales bacterium]